MFRMMPHCKHALACRQSCSRLGVSSCANKIPWRCGVTLLYSLHCLHTSSQDGLAGFVSMCAKLSTAMRRQCKWCGKVACTRQERCAEFWWRRYVGRHGRSAKTVISRKNLFAEIDSHRHSEVLSLRTSRARSLCRSRGPICRVSCNHHDKWMRYTAR